ncbi:MAG: 50S ribosomal protein L9 [Deltaproteobacteria bacterium]|nr:50S ribosomal protein L9 [Deltaproteobacteria bacterium]
MGDIITVKAGFGRNYLIPRGVAVVASSKNVAKLEHDKRVIAQRDSKLLQTIEAVKAKIESISINITKQVGEEEKLFGSVTNKEIADALAAQGVELERRKLQVDEPIRTLGQHNVTINLGRQATANLKVWVVAK